MSARKVCVRACAHVVVHLCVLSCCTAAAPHTHFPVFVSSFWCCIVFCHCTHSVTGSAGAGACLSTQRMTPDSIPPDKHASFELQWRSELQPFFLGGGGPPVRTCLFLTCFVHDGIRVCFLCQSETLPFQTHLLPASSRGNSSI